MKKTVVVTGANRGLGLVLTESLVARGHRVAALVRSPEKMKSKFESCSVLALAADITSDEQVQEAAQAVAKKWGQIHVIVNNAGAVFDRQPTSIRQLPPLEEMKDSMAVHLYGAYSVCRHFLPLFDPSQRGDIIQVTSRLSRMDGDPVWPEKLQIGYRVSKAAQNALTVFLGHHLKGTNIFVNSVCPGWCQTDMGGSEALSSPQEGIKDILRIIFESPEISRKLWMDGDAIPF